MNTSQFRGYAAQPSIVINRADVAPQIRVVAERLLKNGEVTPAEVRLPDSASAEDVAARALPFMEDAVWAAAVEHLEGGFWEHLYGLFIRAMRADDAVTAAVENFSESHRRADLTEQVRNFIAQAQRRGYGGAYRVSNLNGDHYWRLLPANADHLLIPSRDFNSPKCLERIVEICLTGVELPTLPEIEAPHA